MSNEITYGDVFAWVQDNATEDQVRQLVAAGNGRIKRLREQAAADLVTSLKPGDDITTRGIKPKYLNDLTGTYERKHIDPKYIVMKLDTVSSLQAGRYCRPDETIIVPLTAVRKVAADN